MLLSSLRRLVAVAGCTCLLLSEAVTASSQRRNPLNYLSPVEHPVLHTPSHRVHSQSSFDLSFDLHSRKQTVKLRLEPSHDVIAEDAIVSYLDDNGDVSWTEPINRHEHKIFRGRAWLEEPSGSWSDVGWARIMVHRDGDLPLFEGAFSLLSDHHHIILRSNYEKTRHPLDPEVKGSDNENMVVFRDSDTMQASDLHAELKRSASPRVSCPADDLHFNVQPEHPIYSKILKPDAGFWGSMSTGSLFGKRQIDLNGFPNSGNSAGVNLKQSIGKTAGCPNTRRVALVGVATDCTYTKSFDSPDEARANVIKQMNSASDVYERTFNVTLGLHNLTISPANCPGSVQASTPWNTACANNITIQDRLNLFSAWRGQQKDANSHWTLLTTCETGSAVGLSWLGQVCVANSQDSPDTGGGNETVSGANVVAKTDTEWQVIAHETGHTFGAVHDCVSETCSDGRTVNAQLCCPLSESTCDAGERYIMNPSTVNGITEFSPCSIGNICSAMLRNGIKTDCLTANKGVKTITQQQCGNGIVEDGEDCDCGGEESCGNNKCCNPTTCKFKEDAVCDDSNEDCCSGCKFAPSNQVCRASTSECDPAERCTGSSATCPTDATAPDGQTCGNSSQSLACASGQCTSRDLQCKTLMGSFTQNNDTYACDTGGCQLSCASPEFGPSTCYSMQQNFLDGTSCQGGGTCSNGLCEGSSAVKEISSWINRNKPLVIGLGSALGGLLLLWILACVWRCCTRRKHTRRRKPTSSSWPNQNWSQQHMRGVPASGGHSYDASHFWQQQPPYTGPPPPQYPMPSVRYA
ncbi:MAG: hypothetical protein M1825_001152 [Sarcosagium campestre]|nr:MAG: hypothetical protein M1825_001152 [Sarcosagium campestre]